MKIFLLKDLYARNKLPEEAANKAVDLLMELNRQIDLDIDSIDEPVLDELIRYLVANNKNTVESFRILMRYYHVLDRKDLFIHLTKYTGMLNVVENIIKRLESLHGEEKTKEILGDFIPPHLGVPPTELPDYVNRLMDRLDSNLTKEQTETALAGNNHGVSKESMMPESIEYENAPDLDTYLKERHQRKVAELTEYYKEGKVWFEQIITQGVVDFVAANQEVLSGVRKDVKLYVTKIPYDTMNYLAAKTDIEKKYYGCHCPFAREAIIKDGKPVNPRFCYCSAGFAKYPFEVIFNQELKIKVLKSLLMGDDVCRFEIDLAGVDYK